MVTSQCNAICMMENYNEENLRKMRIDLSGDQALSPVVKHTYLRAARGRKSFSKIITDISIILIIPDINSYPIYHQLSQISTIIPDINNYPRYKCLPSSPGKKETILEELHFSPLSSCQTCFGQKSSCNIMSRRLHF